MANQIQTCFQRYEKKYMLTAPQQQFLLKEMVPYMERGRPMGTLMKPARQK